MDGMSDTTATPKSSLDVTTRFLHLGLAVFGIWAWLIGSGWIGAGARDYDHVDHFWYLQHRWVGITFSVFLLLRILWGLIGPDSARFGRWVPWTRERFGAVIEDVRTLLHFRFPLRPTHVGIAGLVQALGLLVFLWIAVSGLCNAFAITPGVKLTVPWLRVVKHYHQIGDVLIPLYLVLHIGGAIAHSLGGKQVWRKMLFLE